VSNTSIAVSKLTVRLLLKIEIINRVLVTKESKVKETNSIRLFKLAIDQWLIAFLIPKSQITIAPGKNMNVTRRNKERLPSDLSSKSNTKNRIKLRIASKDVNRVPISLTKNKFSVSNPNT
jgi:hypothetical protein